LEKLMVERLNRASVRGPPAGRSSPQEGYGARRVASFILASDPAAQRPKSRVRAWLEDNTERVFAYKVGAAFLGFFFLLVLLAGVAVG
jgi:hypothetical protein